MEVTPFDTIFALATPGGSGERAVVRVSGPRSIAAAGELCGRDLPRRRRLYDAELALWGDFHSVQLPCRVLVFPAPASYSGEDVVELHTIASVPLYELLAERLARRGLREAWPGEFTRRAFENGKLDLAQAEAVMQVIRARDEESLRRAEQQLRDGSHGAATALRDRALAVLTLLEAGLDFEARETGAVAPDEWLPELQRIGRELEAAMARVADAGSAATPSFVLLGPANAGKTSLWNALRDAGPAAGLVSDVAGTTRDLRWAPCRSGKLRIADSPGRTDVDRIGSDQELEIIRREVARADGYVWVVAAGAAWFEPPAGLAAPVACVRSKSDLGGDSSRGLACSSVTGAGVGELLDVLEGSGRRGAWRESWEARMAARLRLAAEAVEHGLSSAAADLGAECVAADLRAAVAALEPLDAAHVPDQVLDRVFAGFCLGK